jgi:hypothetical protein
MRAHKDETVKILAPITRTALVALGGIYEQLMPTFSRDGRFDPKALAVRGQSLSDLHLVDGKPDLTKLITEAFLPAVPDIRPRPIPGDLPTNSTDGPNREG